MQLFSLSSLLTPKTSTKIKFLYISKEIQNIHSVNSTLCSGNSSSGSGGKVIFSHQEIVIIITKKLLMLVSISVAIEKVRPSLSLPNIELVDQWASHQKGLVEDGSISNRWEILSSQRAFLCKAIEATKEFTHTEALASFVRSYYKNGNVTRTTLIIYLGSFDKFVKHVKNHKPTLFPGLRKVDWLYLSSEVKQRY